MDTKHNGSPAPTVGVLIRLPVNEHAALKALAEREQRSMNAQVRVLIEQATREAA